MKIREVMSPHPVCCLPTDSAQRVARIMCDHNIGSLPVVMDQESRKLVGVITDRAVQWWPMVWILRLQPSKNS